MPQPVVLSTANLPIGQRVDAWVDLICAEIVGIDVDPHGDENFDAEIELYDFGSLGTQFMSLPEQDVRRTPQMMADEDTGPFFIQQVRSGPMRFRQFGREVEVRLGECALIDGRYPYEMEYAGRNEALSISLAPSWLSSWLPDAETLGAKVLRRGAGWEGALVEVIDNLRRSEARDMLSGEMPLFADVLGSLLALSTSKHAQQTVARHSPALIELFQDTIRSRFYDGKLTPLAVADQHGVSLRTLHLVFAGAGTSFGRELLRFRLNTAQRMLLDRRFAGLAVGEIAMRCGFTNASHFARRFRSRFGQSPASTRRQLRRGME